MDGAQVGLYVGQAVTLVVAVVTGGFAIWGRKVRTPADDQARIAFGVSILEKQLERYQRDADQWMKVEQFLRGELQKSEGENQELRTLIDGVRSQVKAVTDERDELALRIRHLAAMHTRGEAITLEDILGPDAVAAATAAA